MVRFCSSVVAMLANLAISVATPIDTETYRELTDGFGGRGACRGNGGGADRVDSRYKKVSTQAECESVCDTDEELCVAYSYNAVQEDCIIYGAGQDGTCSLVVDSGPDLYHNLLACGECTKDGAVVQGALVEGLCGICSKEIGSKLTASESVCSTVDGVWDTQTWTAGEWTVPPVGWVGDSFTHSTHYSTTNVHTISVAENFRCYDKIHQDGQATCNGIVDGSSCQTAFEDVRTAAECPQGCTYYPRQGNHGPYCDGIALEDSEGVQPSCIAAFEASAAFSNVTCLSIGDDCAYVPAIEWEQPVLTHAPILDLGLGWKEPITANENTGSCQGKSLAQCDGEDNIAGFQYGVCRLDNGSGNGGNVDYKYCKTCINTNGDQVNKDERACAQACLDDPSGSCIGFAQGENQNCIIYGVDSEQYLQHPGDIDNLWGGYSPNVEACLAANVPVGCSPGFDTIKMNEKFVCRHLLQDSSRWLAWGDPSGSETITVELTIIPALAEPVLVGDFTSEMKDELRKKMATLVFVDEAKDVAVEVSNGDRDGYVKVSFSIQTPENVAIPITALIDTILVSKSRDGTHYFKAIKTSDNALKNTGEMFPMSGRIAAISVHGYSHNLVDMSKEAFTGSWSELQTAPTAPTPTPPTDPTPTAPTPTPPTDPTPTAPTADTFTPPTSEAPGTIAVGGFLVFFSAAMSFFI